MRDLDRLHAIRRRHAPSDTAIKRAVLQSIVSRGLRVRSWGALEQAHDDLLFLCAFPDSPEVWTLAVQALGRIEPALRRLSARERHKADDSGMAGSTSRYVYDYAAARWLARRFPGEIRIDWGAVTNAAGIDQMIAAGVTRGEDDALDESDLGARHWLKLASRASKLTDLACLLALAPVQRRAQELFARMYDAAQVPLRWSLAGSMGSTTHNIPAGRRRGRKAIVTPPAGTTFRTAMRAPTGLPKRRIATPLPGIRRAAPPEAMRVIGAARAALAARCREVFATSWASTDEVWLAALGEGAELAIFGLPPDQRVSIEANYGFVLFINEVPAAYGGVTPLYRQANTGINIFGQFRGSEGAFLWTEMLRAFRSLFGVTRFVVNAVQFGEGNDEAIASGAYWFYWRLGFRPASPKLRRLATAEARRLATAKDRGASVRTSAATLRRLAVGDLHLDLSGAATGELFDERWLSRCSLLVTRALSVAHPHSRVKAASIVAKQVAAALGARPSRWPAAEREAFERLAPVVALLPSVRRWSAGDKRDLVAMMRAKGGEVERDFVLRAAAHPRFFPGLITALRARSADVASR